MTGKKLKLEDFGIEKISKDQQKTVHGGDGPTDPTDGKDPNKGGGGGTGGTP